MLNEIKIEIPNDRGKLEEYEVCERWNDLPTHSYFYDDKCEGCRHIIKMGHGRKKFCGRSYPGTWGSPDIRGQMGCLYCKHYTKKITCQTCQECMYEHADNPPFNLIVSKEEYDERMSKVKAACPEIMANLRKELEYMKQYPEAYKYQRALMMIKKAFVEELKDYKNDDLAKMSKEEEMNFELLQELVDRFTKESEKESNEQN